jgi:hypothetical protein
MVLLIVLGDVSLLMEELPQRWKVLIHPNHLGMMDVLFIGMVMLVRLVAHGDMGFAIGHLVTRLFITHGW